MLSSANLSDSLNSMICINSFSSILISVLIEQLLSSNNGKIKPLLSRQKISSAIKLVFIKEKKKIDAVIFKNFSMVLNDI